MKLLKYKLPTICLIFTFFSQITFSQNIENVPQKIGEEVIIRYQSEHPYKKNLTNQYMKVWKQEIYQKDASYLAFHFKKIELSKDDYLIIRNPENTRFWKYTFSEVFNRKNKNGFWSIHIYGEKAIIEIYSKNSFGNYGYLIDKIAKGYSAEKMKQSISILALCGDDDSENAICYENSEPFVYQKSRTVARLLINGTNACTGWLIGDDGHLMTNEHCISNQSDANNLTVEFMAEGSSCGTNCNSWFACPGQIEATSTTLVKVNSNLDYALVKLPTNVVNTYGFLQLRESGAQQNERIYIPQHPAAWGKKVALFSDSPNDAGGVARVFSLTSPRCGGTGNDIGYYADTQGGSSGSPVIGYNDNLVIALHHCANCPNRGVPIQEIIADLGNDLPNNALAGCEYNINITQNVNSGNIDNRKAENNITASNTIFNNAQANYKAENEVILTNGFFSKMNSNFIARIGDCDSENFSKKVNLNVLTNRNIEINKNLIEGKDFNIIIYPNPSNGEITVVIEGKENFGYQLEIFESKSLEMVFKTELYTGKTTLDLKTLKESLYFAKIVTDKKIITKKIIIKN